LRGSEGECVADSYVGKGGGEVDGGQGEGVNEIILYIKFGVRK
jgi:hypothetical protein